MSHETKVRSIHFSLVQVLRDSNLELGEFQNPCVETGWEATPLLTAAMFTHQPPHAFETLDFPIFLFKHLFIVPQPKNPLLSYQQTSDQTTAFIGSDVVFFNHHVVKYHTQQCCKTFTWIFLWHNGNPWRTPNFCSRKTWWWSRSRRSLHPSRRWGRRKAR